MLAIPFIHAPGLTAGGVHLRGRVLRGPHSFVCSVTLKRPPKAALEGRRRPRPIILRGSLRSHLRVTDERLSVPLTNVFDAP